MKYYIYGIELNSPVRFESLSLCCKSQYARYSVNLIVKPFSESFSIASTNKYSIKQFDVVFPIGIRYIIRPDDNLIIAYSDDFQIIESSLFNIPFALLLASKGDLLLHASSFIDCKGRLCAVSAEKGKGKSTLTFLLGKYCDLFGDDTLCVTVNKSYRCSPLFKLTDQTLSVAGFCNLSQPFLRNIAGKAYFDAFGKEYHSSTINSAKLEKIFFLRRGCDRRIFIEKITSKIKKASLLIDNIIGLDYVDTSFLVEFFKTESFRNAVNTIDFFNLIIPNNLQSLNELLISYDHRKGIIDE